MLTKNLINEARVPKSDQNECVMSIGFLGQPDGGLLTANYASGRIRQWENVTLAEFEALNDHGPVSTALFLWVNKGRQPVADYMP